MAVSASCMRVGGSYFDGTVHVGYRGSFVEMAAVKGGTLIVKSQWRVIGIQ